MKECEPWQKLDVYFEGDEERIDAGPRWKGHCNVHINAQRGRVKRIKNQDLVLWSLSHQWGSSRNLSHNRNRLIRQDESLSQKNCWLGTNEIDTNM